MSMTLHSINGQEIVITADNLIAVAEERGNLYVLRREEQTYIRVVESYKQVEPFLIEIED